MSNNDITVLDQNPLIQNYLSGKFQNVSFLVNGHTYDGYYLLAMRYILNKRFLCISLANQAMKNSNGMPKNKRVQEMILRDALECFNRGDE